MDVAFAYHRQKQKVRQANLARHQQEKSGSLLRPCVNKVPKALSRDELQKRARKRWEDGDDWVIVSSVCKSKYEVVNLKELDEKLVCKKTTKGSIKKLTEKQRISRKCKAETDKIIAKVERGFVQSRERISKQLKQANKENVLKKRKFKVKRKRPTQQPPKQQRRQPFSEDLSLSAVINKIEHEIHELKNLSIQ